MNRTTRNILIFGKRTSFRLETPFWDALMICAREQQVALDDLVSNIVGDNRGSGSTMASILRVFLIQHFHEMAEGGRRHGAA
jgi:predicted DNA-binding ribbon-helix-helix protein